MKLAVIIFCFVGAPILTNMGPITIKPKAPKTTDGIPESNSINVWLIFLILFGRNSQINNEDRIPNGIARIIENRQTQKVAVINGRTPNEGGLSVGAHLLPTKRFQKPYFLKASTDWEITNPISVANTARVSNKKNQIITFATMSCKFFLSSLIKISLSLRLKKLIFCQNGCFVFVFTIFSLFLALF